MRERQPRYSKEEFARRGQAIYEKRVRPQVEEGNRGKIVAIDVETGEFEVGEDTLAACDQLLARCPDAQPWLVRIGRRAVHRFGCSHAGSAIWKLPAFERAGSHGIAFSLLLMGDREGIR